MNIQDYRTNWLNEIMNEANIEDDPRFREDIFTEDAISILTEANILDNPMPSPYKSHGVAVNAYDFDDEIKTLHLIVTRFEGINDDLPPLQNSKVKEILKGLKTSLIDPPKGCMIRLTSQQKLMI